MQLEPFLRPELTLVLGPGREKHDVFRSLTEAAVTVLPGQDAEALARRLSDREAQYSTATAEGVAFPHVLSREFAQTAVVTALVPGGVRLSDRAPAACDLIFCMFGNADQPWMHVLLLARMARLVHAAAVREQLRRCTTPRELFDCVLREDRNLA